MNSKEYQLGVINSKISKLLTPNDFNTLTNVEKEDFFDYLFNSDLILNKDILDNSLSASLNEGLNKEILSYIGKDHFIYNYFFNKEIKEITDLNKLVENINTNDNLTNIFSRYHSIKNIILGFRLIDKNIDFLEYKLNLLKSLEYSTSILESSYKQGKANLIDFTNALYNLDLNLLDDLVLIEKKLMNFFYEYIKDYSYSANFYEVLLYYIFIRIKQNEDLKALFYTGDVYYEWTNIYK